MKGTNILASLALYVGLIMVIYDKDIYSITGYDLEVQRARIQWAGGMAIPALGRAARGGSYSPERESALVDLRSASQPYGMSRGKGKY